MSVTLALTGLADAFDGWILTPPDANQVMAVIGPVDHPPAPVSVR